MADQSSTNPDPGSSGSSSTTAATTTTADRGRCLFCRIVDGKEKNSSDKIIYQDNELAVFPDIRPASKFHLLVVTKEHIRDAKSLSKSQIVLLDRIVTTGIQVLTDNVKKEEPAAELELSKVLMGFHWPPFHTISHLHLHVIYPSDQMGFIGRNVVFRQNSYWFVQPEWVRARLEKIQDSSSVGAGGPSSS